MSGLIGALLARLRKNKATPSAARKSTFRPGLECLEDRRVPASIAGTVFVDTTGNGAASLGGGQPGVVVKLFADSNYNGVQDSGDIQVASRTTGASGAYSFTGLSRNTYFIKESVPSGWVRTVPTLSGTLAVQLGTGQNVTGQDFANYHKPNTSLVSNISFTITDATSGTSRPVSNLRGQTQQGDTVTANFTVAPGASATLSFIAYNAPGSSFDANTASQQTPVEIKTGTFGPGQYSLTVKVPDNYYQIDFVMGAAIQQLGPSGSNLFYSAQGRLLSADNGGTQPVSTTPAPTTATLSGTVFSDNAPDANTGLGRVRVNLTGLDSHGNPVDVSVLTNDDGTYSFGDVPPGTYTITAAVLDSYANETGPISGVVLNAGDTVTGVNFLELYVPPAT